MIPRNRVALRRAVLLLALSCALSVQAPAAEVERARALPDYDNRGGKGRPSSTTDSLLWAPRVLLFPAYLATDYLVRRPLGYAISSAEKAGVPAALYDFFAFGPDHRAGVLPTAFVDFGMAPSVGVYAFWDDAGFKGHDLRLHASTWGSPWLSATLTERIQLSSVANLTLTGTATRRPDYAFYGVGADSRADDVSRYGQESAELRVIWRVRYYRSSTLETSLGYRAKSFTSSHYGGDPSLTERAESGAFSVPESYAQGYRAPFVETRATLDTRPLKSKSESGTRLEVHAEQGAGLTRHATAAWLRCGATLGGFLDLGDSGRVISLSLSAELAEPLAPRRIPFSELAALGGSSTMPGFRPGRLYGQSSGVLTLRYSWPIWIWLDGSLQAALGNVFAERFQGARLGRSRFSGAIGVESRGSRDSIFQILAGFGSETFDSGAKVDSIRLVAGARSGF